MFSTEGSLFILLFSWTLFVNKFVLAVLKFQYPTIFQGWQTLFGLAAITTFWRLKVVTLDFKLYTRNTVFQLLPLLLFYVISLYSGSIALATLPVPVFVGLSQLSELSQSLVRLAVYARAPSKSHVVTFLVLPTAGFLLYKSLDHESVGLPALFWIIIHSTCVGFGSAFEDQELSDSSLGSSDILFLCYAFSVISFTPGSFLMGDYVAVQEFPLLYQYKFHAGCVLSGVLGVSLALCRVTMKQKLGLVHIRRTRVAAKMTAVILSLIVFERVSVPTFIWSSVMCCSTLMVTIDSLGISPSGAKLKGSSLSLADLGKHSESIDTSRGDNSGMSSISASMVQHEADSVFIA